MWSALGALGGAGWCWCDAVGLLFGSLKVASGLGLLAGGAGFCCLRRTLNGRVAGLVILGGGFLGDGGRVRGVG